MAIRFTSYEWYKQLLANGEGQVSGQATFFGVFLDLLDLLDLLIDQSEADM